jgi:hypothetical protein
MAIEHGVDLFNEYWKDPSRVSAEHQESAQVEAIRNLTEALSRFDEAEQAVLLTSSGRKTEERYALSELKSLETKWDEGFKNLSEAMQDITKHNQILSSPPSLRSLWGDVSTTAVEDVNENYNFLLDEMKQVKEGDFLGDIRHRLEIARSEVMVGLSNADFVKQLEQIDRGFWTQRGGSRLYKIRFEMYKEVDEEVRRARVISELSQVSGAAEEVNEALREAGNRIRELRDLDAAAFRMKKAHDVSMLILDAAEHRQLSYILKAGLVDAAPKNMEELGKLIEAKASADWPAAIPTRIVDKKYDPAAGTAALEGWAVLGEVLSRTSKKYELQDETRIKGTYRDANGIYTEYARRYLNYWLETVPEQLIRNKIPQEENWKAQHAQLQKLDILRVFAQLNSIGKDIEEKALGRFAKYVPRGEQKVRQFRSSMAKLSDRFFERQCERVLERWGNLSDDAFEARHTLLKGSPALLGKDYFPFSALTPTEFVDAYWTTRYNTRGKWRLKI